MFLMIAGFMIPVLLVFGLYHLLTWFNVMNVNNNNLRPLASERQLDAHIMSPLKTLTGYANGAYQLTDAI